jgi:hypothetical protein
MADADFKVDIESLHDAIRDQVAAAFPDFVTVEFYRDDEDELIPTPACLMAMTEAEPQPDSDAGGGHFPVLLRFEAQVIMAHNGPATRLAVRKAATALATWLYQLKRFQGQVTDPIQVIACEPDEFAPTADKWMVWRVEFVITTFLGETAWTNEGVVPTDVVYSWSPKIGAGNVGEYEAAQ